MMEPRQVALWESVRTAFKTAYPLGQIYRVENVLMRGCPDVVWAAPGHGDGWIELKDGRDKESGPQASFRHSWARAGGKAVVLHRVATQGRVNVYCGVSDVPTAFTGLKSALTYIIEECGEPE